MKEQAIFDESGQRQMPSLRISHKFLAGFFDGQRLRLLDSLALCLPLAHEILCPLPVPEAKRFTYLNSVQRAVNRFASGTGSGHRISRSEEHTSELQSHF